MKREVKIGRNSLGVGDAVANTVVGGIGRIVRDVSDGRRMSEGGIVLVIVSTRHYEGVGKCRENRSLRRTLL